MRTLIMPILSLKTLPSNQPIEKVMFDWSVKKDFLKEVACRGPGIPTKFCSVRCGINASSGALNLYLQMKSKMGLTTLCTSGM